MTDPAQTRADLPDTLTSGVTADPLGGVPHFRVLAMWWHQVLHLITRTLSGLGLDIASARIATEIDQAVDTFYVLDRHGRRLEKPDDIERVRTTLEQALLQPI